MRFKVALYFLWWLYAAVNAHAQELDKLLSETDDFKEIVKKAEAYYKGKDKGRGTGYKQFKRWEYFHSSRLNSAGKIINVNRHNLHELYFYLENYPFGNDTATPAAGSNWEPVAPLRYVLKKARYDRAQAIYSGGLGRVNTVETDPDNADIIYAGTPGGGLWRSTDAGNTWSTLTDGLPQLGVTGVAIDYSTPANNRTIYILTGDGDSSQMPTLGVFKSTDNGDNWYATGLSDSVLSRAHKIKIHPENPDILYVADKNGLFKTTDGGVSWTNTTAFLADHHFYDIEFKPDQPNRMYASAKEKIYYSDNSGNSWTPSDITLIHKSSRIELAVTPANPSYVYALLGGSWQDSSRYGFGGLFRSVDAGLSFTMQSDEPNILGLPEDGMQVGGQYSYDLALAVSPKNPCQVHVGGINTWMSSDCGVSWHITSYWEENKVTPDNYTHADIHDLKFVGDLLYCGSDGGVYVGNNRAENWSDISEGMQITQIYDLALGRKSNSTASPLYFGAQDNGFNAVKANSRTAIHWTGGDGPVVSVLPNDAYVLGSGAHGILILMTNESELDNVSPPDLSEKGGWTTPFDVYYEDSPEPDNAVYVGYRDIFYQATSHHTPLSTGAWINLSNGALDTATNCTHLKVAPSDPDVIYVAKENELYKTTDRGVGWSRAAGNLPQNTGKKYFAIHPDNPDKVYLILEGADIAGQKVYRTDNGGATWSNISGSLPNVAANCIVLAHDVREGLYLGTDIGVFYRDNDRADGVLFNHGLPHVQIMELEIDREHRKIYAATYGRGVWKSDLYTAPCESNLTLTQDLHGAAQYVADNIVSASRVRADANIRFTASEFIYLDKGFEIPKNAHFQAHLDPGICSGKSSGSSLQRKGIYAGPLPQLLKNNNPEPGEEPDTGELYVFPNPTSYDVYLQFELKVEGHISVRLFDRRGNLLKVENKGRKKSGKVVEKLNVADVPPGMYILQVIAAEYKASRRVIVSPE